jgi:hypothetical protein
VSPEAKALGAMVRAQPARARKKLLDLAARTRTVDQMAAQLRVHRTTLFAWFKRLGLNVERGLAANGGAWPAQSRRLGATTPPGVPPTGKRVLAPLYAPQRGPSGELVPATGLGDGMPYGWVDLPDGTRMVLQLSRMPSGQLRVLVERRSVLGQ